MADTTSQAPTSVIIVTQNLMDYGANLEGTDYWGRGSSAKAAIGSLVVAHPEMFNIQITSRGISSRLRARIEYEERSVPDSGTAPISPA